MADYLRVQTASKAQFMWMGEFFYAKSVAVQKIFIKFANIFLQLKICSLQLNLIIFSEVFNSILLSINSVEFPFKYILLGIKEKSLFNIFW